MQKGISPLIAGVLLVAFTLAIGGIAAQFLTGTTTEQTTKASEKGRETVDCGSANIELDAERTSWDGSNLIVNVENTGTVATQIPEVVWFDSSDVATTVNGPIAEGQTVAYNTSTNRLGAGGFATFNISVASEPRTVTVRTGCAGVTSTASNSTDSNDFELVFE